MKLTERMGRLAGAILAIAMAVTSCYDDSALVERVTQLEYDLEALQLTLTEELNALNALMDENIFIKSCEANDDGSYDLTLSSGAKFTVYPDQSLESVVTYISMSGTKYWAYYDENGKAQLIYDSENARIPITTVPKIVLEDGVNYLVFGSERYPLSGNSVFSAYEIHKDEQGNVIAATFTFGDDMKFTIPVGNGNGVRFVYQNIESVIMSVVQMLVFNLAMNSVLKPTRNAVEVRIITSNPEQFKEDILVNLKHGATVVDCHGMYTGEDKAMIITIINIHQMDELIKLSRKYDSTFVYFSDVSGVWGNFRWNKSDAVK